MNLVLQGIIGSFIGLSIGLPIVVLCHYYDKRKRKSEKEMKPLRQYGRCGVKPSPTQPRPPKPKSIYQSNKVGEKEMTYTHERPPTNSKPPMDKPYRFKAHCITCGYDGFVFHTSKEDYQEVTICPKCNGAFVDIWKLGKYKQIEKSNEIAIVMDSPNNPPKVVLNGKEIDGVIEVRFNYDTLTDKSQGQHNFTVKYMDKQTNTIRTVSACKVWEG